MKPPRLLYLIPSLCLLSIVARAEVLERIIAKVNGEIITLSDLQARQLAALRQARVPPERQDAYLRENGRRILDEAIDDALIAQKAEEVGKEVPEEYLKQVVEGIKKDYNIQSDEEFEAQVRSEGLTIEEVKKNIARSLLTRRYLSDEIDKKVVVSDTEVRADYEARKATDYTAAATEQLQEILISSKEPNAEDLAKSVVARARAGKDFAALAREHSSAPSRNSGGDLGRVTRRDMNAALVEVVTHLAPGEVSDPIPVRGGFRILRLVARDAGQVTPFEDVKDALRQRILDRRREEEMNKLAKRLREHAIIQDMVREVPLAVVQTDEPASARPSILDAVEGAEQSPTKTDDEFVTKRGPVRKIVPPPPSGGAPDGSEPPKVPDAPARHD